MYNVADNDPDGDFNTTTGLYTCPVDGWYNVDGSVQMASVASTTSLLVAQVIQNGIAARRGGSLNWTTAAPNTAPVASCDGLLHCSAGDTIGISVSQNSGAGLLTNVALRSNTFMDIHWVGPV